MAVYGNLCKPVNENLSFGQLMDFAYESDNEMNIMFERANIIHVLKEENTDLVIPQDSKYSFSDNPEATKKKFLDKIKELVKKFVQYVTTAIESLKKKVFEVYMNTNFQDQFLSKYKDKVTWENLSKAKEKGWIGTPVSVASICKVASLNDTRLNEEFKEANDNILNEISKLENAQEDKVDEISLEIKKDLDRYKRSIENYDTISMINSNEFSSDFGTDTPFLGYVTNSKAKDGYYYPSERLFNNNKNFAENGQKNIKNIKVSGNASIKLVNDIQRENEKSLYKNTKSDYKSNNTSKQFYLAAKYRYTLMSLFVKASSKSLNALVGVLYKQHKCAIENYIRYIRAINKFCTE